MDIFLLGGNSIDNKAWIDSLAVEMRKHFARAIPLEYAHWKSGGPLMDIVAETDALAKTIGETKDYMIFAKSAGILLCLKAMAEKRIAPKKVVFAGFPLAWARRIDLDPTPWILRASVPVMVIQHENDPALSASELEDYVRKNDPPNWTVITWPGASHHYSELEKLAAATYEFGLQS